ncbi:MAG: hypothetical protein OEW86_08825 [Nitrosopumilus sp.]|nr:hypothetical protein [Nitrosopumilus sp.]MDH3516385.1 hypothetical protein [Nitrosopumilus sp.]MDH3564149.1 hypothetical protein [Nitrosopumilus sp.]MDH5418068.1 hypothetical protein [Nitrosopumilus sp.]MDH5553982.1 hypothetical protein [Nitrosopumilus sp.]
MDGELHRKINEAKSLHKKYVQMMGEHMVKENVTDEDFNRRIMKVYHCMISAYDEINQEIGLSYNK